MSNQLNSKIMKQFELNAIQNSKPALLLKALKKQLYPSSEEELSELTEGKPLNKYQEIALIRECNPNLLLKTFMK